MQPIRSSRSASSVPVSTKRSGVIWAFRQQSKFMPYDLPAPQTSNMIYTSPTNHSGSVLPCVLQQRCSK